MTKRPIAVEDILRVRHVRDPQIAPDGSRIAFGITVIEAEKEQYRTGIYQVSTDGGKPEHLADGTWHRWSPDGGKLAFLSISGKEIWVLESTGAKRQVAALEGAISALAWSPDGNRLAVIAKVKLPAAPLAPVDGIHHITRLKYKSDGTGYNYDQRTQLFVVDAKTGEAQQLTDTPFGAESPAWSPDGARIGFITAPEDPDGTWERLVATVPAAGGTPQVICGGVGVQDLSWSPDGQHVAFRAATRQYIPSVSFALWIAPATGGDPRNVTAGFDRFVGGDRTLSDAMLGKVPQGGVWSADSKSLYFLVADQGENTLCQVSVAGGPVQRLNDPGQAQVIFNFDYCPATGLLITAASTPTNPGDLWRVQDGKRLTALNDAWLAEVDLVEPESVQWTSHDGTPVTGWILKPPGFQAGTKYPAVLEVHGGPYRQYGQNFFHELQLLAAEGFVVLYPNPRGTQGYGQEFADAIHNDWGNNSYHDLMTGVDHLISLGYVDENRIGVTGGSYGGYMTNWIVTQTNRFKAAVSDRCLSNIHSFMGTSDVAFSFGEPDYGDVWNPEQVARMLEHSPITHVKNVQTPLLIMHQNDDHCCALEQAEQFYVALKRLGREVEMLLFPGACHELSRSGNPRQRIQRLQWIVAWFRKYLDR